MLGLADNKKESEDMTMPLPIGHTAIGLAAYETLPSSQNPPSRLAVAAYISFLSNLPDLDILFGLLLHGNGAAFHRGPTHSLLFAVLAGVIASQMGRVWPVIPRFGFGLSFALIFSHVLADLLLTDAPVSLLWPLEVYWTPGFNGWGNVLHTVVFKSIQDAGIVAVSLVYLLALRHMRSGDSFWHSLSNLFRVRGHA
jgi:membrane-bound metal-dependent hydrolase YbcI (DUF457 family)